MLVSVLIGLVSTEDKERILETLDALRTQAGDQSYEVVIADRRQDSISALLARDYPEVRLLPCPPSTSLAELRTIALEHSRGEIVAVTEDHCVPAPGWLAAIVRTFAAGNDRVAAVGGCVENGVTERRLDWATFLCEYAAFLPPVPEGHIADLPGMNVAYRRDAVIAQPRELLASGFWETVLHPRLRGDGWSFLASNAIRMRHAKRFSFGLFAHQRYLYSRYYAGRRFPPGAWLKRWAAALATPLLPPLLLARMARHAREHRDHARAFVGALPFLLLFAAIWAAGEAVGYAAGGGDVLRRIE